MTINTPERTWVEAVRNWMMSKDLAGDVAIERYDHKDVNGGYNP